MSADAMARLRTAATLPDDVMGGFVTVKTEHLRAVLDRATLLDEALDALAVLEDACASVASWSEECLEFNDPRRAAVRAVLAKAGRP